MRRPIKVLEKDIQVSGSVGTNNILNVCEANLHESLSGKSMISEKWMGHGAPDPPM